MQKASLVILNSSGEVQAEHAMRHWGGSDKTVKAIMMQEHHCGGTEWLGLQHTAKSRGWDLQGAEAIRAEGGKWRSGTCVMARSRIGLGTAAKMAHDISPPGSEGRLSVAWIDGLLRGGVCVLSIYLWH